MARTGWMISMVLLLAGSMLGAGEPVKDAMTAERLEPMLQADPELVVQTFRRHPGQVLPFVDGYLEGGLKIIEEGGDRAEATASFRTGVQFARCATEAFDDPVFLRYAANFASWSPTEQKNFRAGQKAYGDGRTEERAGGVVAALAHFERSWALAAALHDTWGMAMASGGRARALQMLELDVDAYTWAQVSAELYGSVRLEGNHAGMRLLCAQLAPEAVDRLEHLAHAWASVGGRPADDEQRAEVRAAYVAALEAAGQSDVAANLDDGP